MNWKTLTRRLGVLRLFRLVARITIDARLPAHCTPSFSGSLRVAVEVVSVTELPLLAVLTISPSRRPINHRDGNFSVLLSARIHFEAENIFVGIAGSGRAARVTGIGNQIVLLCSRGEICVLARRHKPREESSIKRDLTRRTAATVKFDSARPSPSPTFGCRLERRGISQKSVMNSVRGEHGERTRKT